MDLRVVVLFVSACVCGTSGLAADEGRGLRYPETRRVDVTDDYHGTQVADPYRWMEELDAPELKAWIEAQNEVTFGYLESIEGRDRIRARLTELWDYEKYGTPEKHGDRLFFQKNDGLQNQYVYYVMDEPGGEPRVLLDPNTLSEDGTVAVTATAYSQDGGLMVYGLSTSGSDWKEFRVRDVATGEDLDDHLKWIKFSGASWSADGKGFYYSRYDAPEDPGKLESVNEYQKLYYHRIGTPQSEDRLIYHRPDEPEWGFSGTASDDGRYLIIHVRQGTERKSRLYYVDLEAGDDRVVKLLDDFDAQYYFIDNDGPVFWVYTDKNAPLGRVVVIDTRDPQRENWRVVIPETENTLEEVNVIGAKFVVTYLKDARAQVRLFRLDGTPAGELELPGPGSVSGFAGRRGDTETFFSFRNFTTPSTVYRLDTRMNRVSVFRKPDVAFEPDKFESTQVFYRSKDGTRVPMFISHRKGLKLDGRNPALLGAYGGFRISVTPYFNPADVVWMEMGGILARANIRGGGEYGTAWHEHGRLKNKQNCFDDFIAAGEYLIDQKYTCPEKLAITGGSNGGLLVGACLCQRPDLFAAAVPHVGVFDMLRFHRYTIGWAWVTEYGSADDPEMFPVLHRYSPLHNVKPGTHYPATLICTSDHDDRVVPSHSFKFAATLQAAQAGAKPVLIRVETKAGHGSGTPASKRIEQYVDQWAFLKRTLDIRPTIDETGMTKERRNSVGHDE